MCWFQEYATVLTDLNQNWWRPGDGLYHQGSAGICMGNHYFKRYTRFPEAAQPKIAWGRRDPAGTRSPPRDRAQSGREAPRRCVSWRKVSRDLGKIRNQSENQFFRAGTSVLTPGSHSNPPDPSRIPSPTVGPAAEASRPTQSASLAPPGV